MVDRGSSANGDRTLSNDELVAGLRELLEMQDAQLREKDREIAALKRAAANRERRDVG